jgi:hypothetical protein
MLHVTLARRARVTLPHATDPTKYSKYLEAGEFPLIKALRKCYLPNSHFIYFLS